VFRNRGQPRRRLSLDRQKPILIQAVRMSTITAVFANHCAALGSRSDRTDVEAPIER
jgi:hypothetical protein